MQKSRQVLKRIDDVFGRHKEKEILTVISQGQKPCAALCRAASRQNIYGGRSEQAVLYFYGYTFDDGGPGGRCRGCSHL